MYPRGRQVSQLWQPMADIIALPVEFLTLQHGIENSEVRGRIRAASSNPLPAGAIVGQVRIHQCVPKPMGTRLPMDSKMFGEEGGHDHSHPVVHPARLP